MDPDSGLCRGCHRTLDEIAGWSAMTDAERERVCDQLPKRHERWYARCMGDADVAEILKLPPEERMRLAEIIWASLASDPGSVPLGDAHRAVIDERLAEDERDPDDVLSRDEVLSEARRR